MKNFKNREEAFASQNFDPSAVRIEGVPERHIEALKAVANLFIIHDAVNPDFQPDYSDYNQKKWDNVYLPGSPSGVGFRFIAAAYWDARSHVGARLVSETDDAAEHVNDLGHEDYKALMVYERPKQQ